MIIEWRDGGIINVTVDHLIARNGQLLVRGVSSRSRERVVGTRVSRIFMTDEEIDEVTMRFSRFPGPVTIPNLHPMAVIRDEMRARERAKTPRWAM